jgi:hypothetical protein
MKRREAFKLGFYGAIGYELGRVALPIAVIVAALVAYHFFK